MLDGKQLVDSNNHPITTVLTSIEDIGENDPDADAYDKEGFAISYPSHEGSVVRILCGGKYYTEGEGVIWLNQPGWNGPEGDEYVTELYEYHRRFESAIFDCLEQAMDVHNVKIWV